MANKGPLPQNRKDYSRSASTSEAVEAEVIQEPTSSPPPEEGRTEKSQKSWLISQMPALAALLGVAGLTAVEATRIPETQVIDKTVTVQRESEYNDAHLWKRVRTLERELLDARSELREAKEAVRTVTKTTLTQRRMLSKLRKEVKAASAPRVGGYPVRLVKRRTADMLPVYVSRSKLYSVEQ